MPVLCFVIDTSASMNQRTASGQRIIDHAKTAVENFIFKVKNKGFWRAKCFCSFNSKAVRWYFCTTEGVFRQLSIEDVFKLSIHPP